MYCPCAGDPLCYQKHTMQHDMCIESVIFVQVVPVDMFVHIVLHVSPKCPLMFHHIASVYNLRKIGHWLISNPLNICIQTQYFGFLFVLIAHQWYFLFCRSAVILTPSQSVMVCKYRIDCSRLKLTNTILEYQSNRWNNGRFSFFSCRKRKNGLAL